MRSTPENISEREEPGRAMPSLTEIDLSQTTKSGGAGLEAGPTYLCLIDGHFRCGYFSKVWFGLNFHSGTLAFQYDPPGTNYSGWQKVWRMDNAEDIASALELDYATARRRYAIDHGMRSNGQRITEDAPLEAFHYYSEVPAMPPRNDEDDEDYC